jgi:hypothetical protein
MRGSADEGIDGKGWRIEIGRSFARLALRSVAKSVTVVTVSVLFFSYTLPHPTENFVFSKNEIHRKISEALQRYSCYSYSFVFPMFLVRKRRLRLESKNILFIYIYIIYINSLLNYPSLLIPSKIKTVTVTTVTLSQISLTCQQELLVFSIEDADACRVGQTA